MKAVHARGLNSRTGPAPRWTVSRTPMTPGPVPVSTHAPAFMLADALRQFSQFTLGSLHGNGLAVFPGLPVACIRQEDRKVGLEAAIL